MKRIFFLLIFIFACIKVNFKDDSKALSSTWNIIFYIAADNDLNKHGFNTVQTAAEGYLQNPDVNVFFMCDGISTEEFSIRLKGEASYYKLENGSLVKIEHKGIINSGSLESFKNFIDFVLDKYGNADNTALFLWGHGSNIKLLEYNFKDGDSNKSSRDTEGIFLADVNVPYYLKGNSGGLSFNELIEATKYVKQKLNGKKIDILGLDACTLMKVEIAYEVKDNVHYLLASQIKQNALSWNYKDVLNYLSKNCYVTPIELVEKIVSSYKHFYEFKIYNSHYNTKELRDNRRNDAISALNLTLIEEFKIAFEAYIQYLINFLKTSSLKTDFIMDFLGTFNKDYTQWTKGNILKGSIVIEFIAQEQINEILSGQKVTFRFDSSLDFIDIKGMMQLIYKWFENSSLSNEEASEFFSSLKPYHDKAYKKFNELVIFNYNREKKEELNGLSIRNAPRKNDRYVQYLFGNENWVKFLKIVHNLSIQE